MPASVTYNIESTFGSQNSLLRSRAKPFLSMNPELNKTAREESVLDKFLNTCTKIPTEGIASYDINLALVKKQNPSYSQSRAK